MGGGRPVRVELWDALSAPPAPAPVRLLSSCFQPEPVPDSPSGRPDAAQPELSAAEPRDDDGPPNPDEQSPEARKASPDSSPDQRKHTYKMAFVKST